MLGDRKRLVQVVANLLNNEAKYTPDKGAISLEVGIDGSSARIEMSDSSRLRVPGLRPREDPMARKLMACSLIAASATRSSDCICWNLLVICTPYRFGKVLHFRFETAVRPSRPAQRREIGDFCTTGAVWASLQRTMVPPS